MVLEIKHWEHVARLCSTSSSKTYTLRNILHTCSAASRTVLEHDLHLYDSTPGHQPDMVCQPCSWSAEQGKPKTIFSGLPFTPENLVSRDRFGRPVPRQSACLFSTPRLNLLFTRGIAKKEKKKKKKETKKKYICAAIKFGSSTITITMKRLRKSKFFFIITKYF